MGSFAKAWYEFRILCAERLLGWALKVVPKDDPLATEIAKCVYMSIGTFLHNLENRNSDG